LSQPEGSYPDEMFYGYVQLARRPGVSADMIERASPSALGLFAQRVVHSLLHLSPDFGNLRALNRGLLERYDVVVSVHEPVLLTLALRKAERGAALVPIFIGGEKRLSRSRFPALTRRLLRFLFERSAAIIVVGEGEREYLLREKLASEERVHLIQFGVDERFWTPAPASVMPAETQPILAVGNDDGRDYDTLLRAIGEHPLRLHTNRSIDSRLLRPNVQRTSGDWHGQALSDLELRDLYRNSRFVVTPLSESAQPSGQSVTLQAMACGKAVLLSRTRGLWSADWMRHMENCVLVPPGDVAALRGALEVLALDAGLRQRLGRAARESVERHFTSLVMGDQIALVLEKAAGSR
jgi:glycosyltransferase involved in cell wall biosynthesis